MCIVIDTNVLASVFKSASANHNNFKPVLDWVTLGKGKVVFGGTKYIKELGPNYGKLFLLLRDINKAVFIPNDLVDKEENIVSEMIVHPDFDDQHLVGLLRVSKCKLICSDDARAYQFFRHLDFFGVAANRPRIYSSAGNIGLLCDRHIADVCGSCSNSTNAQKEVIEKILP